MKVKLFTPILAFSFAALVNSAGAVQTHVGKVDVELDRIDNTGKMKLAKTTADFHLDWVSGNCEVQLGTVFYYCKLDHSKDLLNSKGTLVMQKLPVIHFDLGGIDPLLLAVGLTVPSPALSFNMATLIDGTDANRSSGLDIPMYSCAQCEITDLPAYPVKLINAYTDSVTRTIEITDDSLGEAKLVFSITLKQMHANAAAFQIVGDNAAGNFGP